MEHIIFLLSAPRAGSTALQKLILSNSKIDSESESWWLLPLLAADEKDNCMTIYGADGVNKAVNMIDTEDWFASIRAYYEAILRTREYKKKWYLDKTPRYAIYASKLSKIFPKSKFIILSRHPISVLKSHQETWASWWLRLPIDRGVLLKSFEQLNMLEESKGMNVLRIDYISLLENPKKVADELSKYLGLRVMAENADNRRRAGNKIFGDPNFGKKSREYIKKDNFRVEFSVYLFYRLYFKSLGSDRKDYQVYFSIYTPTRLITWPIVELITTLNFKAIIRGFRRYVYR